MKTFITPQGESLQVIVPVAPDCRGRNLWCKLTGAWTNIEQVIDQKRGQDKGHEYSFNNSKVDLPPGTYEVKVHITEGGEEKEKVFPSRFNETIQVKITSPKATLTHG